MTKEFKAIGIMSGTSLDGLDISYNVFRKTNSEWSGEIVNGTTIAYSEEWTNRLSNAHNSSGFELTKLDFEFGTWIGEKTLEFIKKNTLRADIVGSHGHTIFHQPDNGITLQIGNGNAINSVLEIPVVCDFRTKDVMYGGQGAPLVPIGDQLLYKEYDACINLGGIANMSCFDQGNYLAFDICPANMVLNYFAKNQGQLYDDKGQMAASGKIDHSLLRRLNSLPYYKIEGPKSLGKEWVDNTILPSIEDGIKTIDVLATLSEHISEKIAESILTCLSRQSKKSFKILITGGGAYNDYLIEKIRVKLGQGFQCIIPSAKVIEHKESQIFALLAALKVLNITSNIKTVTGSSKNISLGVMYN